MMIKAVRCRKRGSVIVIVAGVFVALLAILGSFMKTTSSRVHTTKKLGDAMLAREFATSLAALANHYIKNVELKDSDSKLRKVLSTPLKKMAAESTEDITSKFSSAMRSKVKSGAQDVLTLLENGSGLNKLKWQLSWIVNENDFKAIEYNKKTPYPREKDGLIRVYMTISHVLPGTSEPIKEDYMFVSQIRVVANIIPVLSKFTLYVEDALNGESETRLNLVSTKATGNLNGGATYRPWVLDNGEGSDKPIDNYKDLCLSPRGFAYLGGGTKSDPIALGIARGWNDSGVGEYGEDFHFFKNSNAAEGYWKTIELFGGGKGIMASDIGLCDDTSDDNLRAWQAQLGGGYSQKSKSNSIFKLYGTDGAKSPTLVLGHVDSMYASIRIFKTSAGDLNFLSYIDHEDDYLSGCGFSVAGLNAFESGYDILTFYNTVGGNLAYDDYISKYASRLSQTPYNKDYLYILTHNSAANPKGQVSDTKLKSLAGYSSSASDFTAVPEGYNNIVEGADLTDMGKFLDIDKLSIDCGEESTNNMRIAYTTSVTAAGDNIESYFSKKGLLDNGELNLNGWVYVKSDSTLEININKCKVISNGGIIVDGGDICVKGDVQSVGGAHLTLVALSGKINIEAGVTNIDASLYAGGGQVRLLGKATDGDLKINGNVVMKKINSLEHLAAGCWINYKDELSALPDKVDADEDRSEKPMLMFSFKDNPKMFD